MTSATARRDGPLSRPARHAHAALAFLAVAFLAPAFALPTGGCGGGRAHVRPAASGGGGGDRSGGSGEPASRADYAPRPLKLARLSRAMCARCEELLPMIEQIAAAYGLEAALLAAIVRVESGFRGDARSRAGARGLMQLMPRTGRGLDCGDLFDGEANLRCGARLLQRHMKRFGGNLIYVLAAYNGGAGYVKKAWHSHTLPRNFAYVEKVLEARTFFLRHSCCESIVQPPAAAP